MPEPQTTIPILAKKIKIHDISVYRVGWKENPILN